MDRIEKMKDMFLNGSSCSQSVLAVYGPSAGIDAGLAHRIGAGLGGGLGRKQYICGAVNAGAIILGLMYGSPVPGDAAAKEKTCARVWDFIETLEKKLGASSCLDLLGWKIATPEERTQAGAKGLFGTICTGVLEAVGRELEKEFA